MSGYINYGGHIYCRQCDYEDLIIADPSMQDVLIPVSEMSYAFLTVFVASNDLQSGFEELAKQAMKEPERKFHCCICGKVYMFRQGAKECERNHRRLVRGR